MGLFKKKEKRNNAEIPVTFADALNFSSIYNSYQAMNISAVYRAVDIISDSVAMLPIYVTDERDKEINHQINWVFRNMNLTKFNFMKLMVKSVLLKGNGFAFIEWGEDGLRKPTVLNIRYLDPSEVTINYDKKTGKLSYTVSNFKKRIVEPFEMIHLIKNSYDGVNGQSVVSYATRAIKLANNTENSANSFFTNGCNLAGVLTVQGQLSDKQRNDIRSSWNQAYSNGGNGLAVLQGNMEYKPIQLSAADSQLLESRAYNVQDIARFFGISPVLLGDLSNSSYNTIEAAQNEFLLHTLQPYITMIEEEFTRKLFLPSETGFKVCLNENELLKTDKTAQAQYYGALLDKGVLSINEVREELGYNAIDGGDRHTIAYSKIEDNTIETKNN